jgi:hypothetical protein
LFAVEEDPRQWTFLAYDPNCPEQPALLHYDPVSRRFAMPATFYFAGGRVDVYEVYRGVCF